MKIKSKASKRENVSKNKIMIIFIFSLARLIRLEDLVDLEKKLSIITKKTQKINAVKRTIQTCFNKVELSFMSKVLKYFL